MANRQGSTWERAIAGHGEPLTGNDGSFNSYLPVSDNSAQPTRLYELYLD